MSITFKIIFNQIAPLTDSEFLNKRDKSIKIILSSSYFLIFIRFKTLHIKVFTVFLVQRYKLDLFKSTDRNNICIFMKKRYLTSGQIQGCTKVCYCLHLLTKQHVHIVLLSFFNNITTIRHERSELGKLFPCFCLNSKVVEGTG